MKNRRLVLYTFFTLVTYVCSAMHASDKQIQQYSGNNCDKNVPIKTDDEKEKYMKTLYCIAGASGSGKTSIIKDLSDLLGAEFVLFDFDEIGVPAGSDKKWRQESTEKWLQRLLQEKKQPILLGQTVLGEILACPSAKLFKKINFCLLDVNDFARIQRLKKRDTYGADQHMLNWAAWLRMHHQDPQWMQSVLKDECWDGLNFSSWDQLDTWDNKAAITILDTKDFSIPEVAELVAQWITKYRAYEEQ